MPDCSPIPPPLPWLTLPNGTFLSIPGGEIIQMPVPHGACCHGSIDNWLFLIRSDGEFSLMNPFSKATMDLPNLAMIWLRDWFNLNSTRDPYPLFYKLVAPSPLDSSPNTLVAALILDNAGYSSICMCRPPLTTDLSTKRLEEPFNLVDDLEFFDGKLHASSYCGELLAIEIDDTLGCKLKMPSIKCLIDPGDHFDSWPQHLPREETYLVRTYLIKCDGRLLMVKRWIATMALLTSNDFFEHKRTVAFQVSEADLSTYPGRWRRVNNLGGQGLFIGRHCSKSLPAGECNGIHENCIYFICDYLDLAVDPLRDSGVYDITNGTIIPLSSKHVETPPHYGLRWCPTWVFPADAM